MTNTDQSRTPAVQPEDPAIQAGDPAMFAPLTLDENGILGAHLNSGWYKQSAVYPRPSDQWHETRALLHDLHGAWNIAWDESHPVEGSPGTEPEPEAEAG
jgi:hypothetical protein